MNSHIEPDLQHIIESSLGAQDEEADGELYETLLLYYSHPLNLNQASVEELRSLFILTEEQVSNFVNYKVRYGRLLTIYELQAIPGFDLSTIYKLLPFVRVTDDGLQADTRSLLSRIWSEQDNYLLLRYQRTLEKQEGYIENDEGNSRYAGSPDQLLLKFRVRHAHDFSLGLTAEKDAGEALTFDKSTGRYGADFYSFHFQLQDKGRLKNLVLGDYKVQFGQSLLLAAGFNIGKNPETITTNRRSNLGVLPFTSTIESNYFRGGAATYKLSRHLEYSGFYSRVAHDALLEKDTLVSQHPFTRSVKVTGMHRTASELTANNQIVHQTLGSNILYHDKDHNLQANITMVADFFSAPIIGSGQPYKQFDFYGQDNLSVSISGNYNWQNVNFFAETGRSGSGGLGAVGGFIAHLTPSLQTSMLLRSYARNFHSLHGQAFGELGSNQNEKGVYWGLKYQPSRKYQFTAYFDRFTFPWLKYRVDAPSDGYEYLGRLSYKPNRRTHFFVQFREQSKARNRSDNASRIKVPENNLKRSYIINLDYKPDKIISLKSRIQFSNYNAYGQITQGFAIVQDVNLDLNKIRVGGRLALFDTEDYDNRQYAYERDVLYGFSIPPYSGQGTRQYILLQYKATRKIDLWVRFARTHYRQIESIGSGPEKIEGNIKTDMKLQTRIKF
ncbi:helix-hairpin-helix domain-containing protein [Fulvivirga ulvae]|uniref:ComEA family DNA-binding protein n=1 Tax=Fulvivirga ulvae TaxID=2904245 RepID=UPI001F454E52|nr:helix-hairpin-helix domain-containing protein [Fulvivirga ulvae]UII29962.1 helix-hairpin-helix domain-containing protein [Fulvivirga ulvae]